jgi:FtsP/CotA-like multicopper oxidase with cupredoxin domain
MHKRKNLMMGVLLAAVFLAWGLSPPMAQSAAFPVVGPNGYYTPDYFGETPNWAWSPLLTKFKDPLPQLWDPRDGAAPAKSIPLAVPDKLTYPGSDYYEISLEQFSEVMHSELPATRLRGYRQTNNGTNLAGDTNNVTPAAIRYLGPIIVATKDRPVRIKFTNSLPGGAAGKLFVPVDVTLMGAGPGPNATRNMADDLICASAPNQKTPDVCFTENRSNIHLHGGRSPWISDGTPHQWIIPAADENPLKKGASVVNVPDMWFLPNGTHVTACAGMTTCPSQPTATNDPGNGSQTYYYTNQQSARLLFYHDHAWGITRLNVYVGMAAGYVITDAMEDALINGGTINGRTFAAGTIPPFADMIPLVIQDKTFVDAGDLGALSIPENEIMTTDPTWAWGTNPAKPATTDPVSGDLWWPHVYMTAQNPYAGPAGNAFNPMGRWVYGPWFWPPTPICGSDPEAVKPFCIEYGVVPNPYSDQAGQPPEIPGTPNPSWGAEAFLDTPVVNGVAYPKVQLEAKKYRFRILNASHDRFFNLQLYRAANKNHPTTPDAGTPVFSYGGGESVADMTEVAMVPAGPNAAYVGDLEFWPVDGRVGGAPDPATRGPAIVQIGNEGGFLPKPVVLPNQPINWNMDPTLFTAGLVLQQNQGGGTLMLGPAERADVIIDFSDFAGHTLILYNDAPAPWPALDPHYDYFTGVPDTRAEMGGPLTTAPGKGPNTRTLMQITVAGGQNTGAATPNYYTAATITALENAFKSTATPGVFASSQDPIVAGQGDFWRGTADAGLYDAYDTAYNKVFPITYPNWGISTIFDTSLKFQNLSGQIKTVKMKAKAIQDEMGEVFDDYGRMSAKLGLEVPFTNAANNNFNLQNFVDPATEIVYPNDIQIWKITHNGVDTHPVHFHLFDVQVLNRVGWDGFIEIPDTNELGWKETVRVSPLQDTIVALKPIVPQVPFAVPTSVRPLNPAMPLGVTTGFSQIDPATGADLEPNRRNAIANFGHEYVWHCHILSHEESDMMRPMVLNLDQLLYTVDAEGVKQWELGNWTTINAAVPTQIVADGPRMYASVTGSGTWQWDGSTWTRIGTSIADKMVASDGILYADYGASGLHKWDGSAWVKIGTSNPENIVISGTILYVDYGAAGVHKYNGSTWAKIGTTNPTSMVASQNVLYATFEGQQGIYKWDGSAWTKIGTSNPAAMVASGSVLYATFTGQGLYKWDISAWTKIGTSIPAAMVASGSVLYATFTGQGLYKWDGSAWTRIGTSIPAAIVASGSVLYADFGATGLHKWEGGTWARLSTIDPSIIVAGF